MKGFRKITAEAKKLIRREAIEHVQKTRGFVEYSARRFVPDPNGPITAKSGRRGYYKDWEDLGNPTPIVSTTAFENLLNTDGRDKIHDDMYITTSKSGSGFNFIALTTDVAAPAAGDTVLASEITTGGLARIQAGTRTHVDNTNVSTIEHTFTATAVHTAIVKSGLFNLIGPPPAGVMGHENTFTSASLQIDDQIKVTWTITAG